MLTIGNTILTYVWAIGQPESLAEGETAPPKKMIEKH